MSERSISGKPPSVHPEKVKKRPVMNPRGFFSPAAARELTDNERTILTLSEQFQTRSLAMPQGSVRRVVEAMSHSPHVREDVRERLRVFLDTHRPS
jgi:hypothetical protein